MKGIYSFGIEPWRGLLRITFTGFFAVEDLAGYVDAKEAALKRLGRAANDHLTLCDFSACIPQSATVLSLFRASIDDPRAQSRRLAVVVNSALGNMQAKRIVTRSNAAFFDTIREAEHWLFAEHCHRPADSTCGASPAMTSAGVSV